MNTIEKTKEIIPVEQGTLGLQVDSRELHLKLKIATRYNDWITRQIQFYQFVEGEDFYSILSKSTGGRRAKYYILTLDMAKELAMVENNESGRAIRRYFIEVEKRYRDWIGFWLPKLEQDIDLFGTRLGYNYWQLLTAIGANTSKHSFRSRINKNRQEFWKNQQGVWYVSQEYGKNIVLYMIARKGSFSIKQRRLNYECEKYLLN